MGRPSSPRLNGGFYVVHVWKTNVGMDFILRGPNSSPPAEWGFLRCLCMENERRNGPYTQRAKGSRNVGLPPFFFALLCTLRYAAAQALVS